MHTIVQGMKELGIPPLYMHTIVQRMKELGIPHITYCGSEPQLPIGCLRHWQAARK